jgi:hypothetical protein
MRCHYNINRGNGNRQRIGGLFFGKSLTLTRFFLLNSLIRGKMSTADRIRIIISRTRRESNRYYGHESILKQYCSKRIPSVVTGVIQHGWRRDNGIHRADSLPISKRKANANIFVWNRFNREEAERIGCRHVFPIGAPFIYMDRIPEQRVDRESLVLFPSHSWENEPFRDEYRSYRHYISKIGKIKNRFSSVTVCLYWLQYSSRELREMISGEGFRIICMGHRDNNPGFLHNFRRQVSRFEYVSSNVYSTAVFYALFMNKKTFIYGGYDPEEIRWLTPPDVNIQETMKREYPELCWDNFRDKCHHEIGRRELGWEFRKTPKELYRILGLSPRQQLRFLLS